MKIAIIGTGISGLAAAHELYRDHDLRIFEAANYVGGHTATRDVEVEGQRYAIDTGFIVFNLKTYPEFVRILEELGVTWQPSDMSFSARSDRANLEYSGPAINNLLAQRSNILRPGFWRMVTDILRFYQEGLELLSGDPTKSPETLGEYLRERNYSQEFIDYHIVPMSAAIWSSQPGKIMEFPARYLVQFFDNHGFMGRQDKPQWLTIRGGSREYVRKLIAPFSGRIELRTPIARVTRSPRGVEVRTTAGQAAHFDQVILATHADQTLRLLADATPLEREILSQFAYQENQTVLHMDPHVMPRRRRAWASWNYHIDGHDDARANVTYWMNRLQSIRGPHQFFVTLNDTDRIDPNQVLETFTYHHPIYTPESVRAQERYAEISGARSTWFAGAYWRYGFHEDGAMSGVRVARAIREGRRQAA